MKKQFGFEGRNRLLEFTKNQIFNRKISAFIWANLCLIFLCFSTNAQTLAPGAPGKDAQWSSAGKQAIGTSASLESKVWFTLQGGALTEVYYPDVTVANVHKLEFVVVDPKTKKVERETENSSVKTVRVNGNLGDLPAWLGKTASKDWIEFNAFDTNQRTNALYFTQININEASEWAIIKSYITDPQSNTVLMRVRFGAKDKNKQLYVYYDPSLANTGMHDTAWNEGEALLSQEKSIASALVASVPLSEISSGFYQTSDGLEQLESDGKIVTPYAKSENGNVAQIAKVNFERGKQIDFALGFGKTPAEALQTAKNSLNKFDKKLTQYTDEWRDYVKTLPNVAPKYQAQFNMAAMVLKAQEDKTVRGANVASLTIPWGGGANANEDIGGGYHLVWSRDLYQVVTAYMALGDTAAANRALDFLFNIQQKPDGSFPQNSWLDGKQGWGSLQLDEVAYPLIMAYQLKRFDKKTYENHVKKAADFLVKTGPKTPQERWEEKSGYSPSTIAAEIAGLVCAADIARRNGDETSANIYLKTADDWAGSVEKWTATTNGKYGDGNYYVRLTENGKPDAKEKTELSNNAGTAIENEIVDAGFLELVRLGIKSPDDPLIQKSLKVIDQTLRVNTPNGESFYRYTNDGYGEMDDGRRWNWDGKYTGKGRLWALLAGERGQYELAMYDFTKGKIGIKDGLNWNDKAKRRLDAMLNFANESLMIAEQIWDKPETPKNIDKQFVPDLKFGEGTGSATPLAWSMAQFIRLAVNLKEGKNLDTPDIVYERYVLGKKSAINNRKPENNNITEVPAAVKVRVKVADKFFQNSEAPKPKDSCEIVENYLTNDVGMFGSKEFGKKNPVVFHQAKTSTSPLAFAYSGIAKDVEIVGDFTGWKPCGLKFVESENLKVFILNFPNSARVEYKLIVDGKWINDPQNPNKVDNGVGGENSFFTMPDYKPTAWADSSGMTKSGINIEKINSKIYGAREIKIYIPENSANQNLPVMYLSDGTDYINRADAITIQRNLIKANKIKPFIMVFIDYKDRTKEYWATDDYAKFLATEVIPVIDAKYKTIKSRDSRAIFGTSLGGITSVHTALKYPEIFGRVGSQSGAFWVDDERVIKEVENFDAGKNKFIFYLDSGTLEGADDDRRVAEILRKKNFDVTFQTGETGHNWTSWRDRLADAFIALWGN